MQPTQHGNPQQPFVTIVSMKGTGVFAALHGGSCVLEVRDDTLTVWSAGNDLLFTAPLSQLVVGSKRMQVTVDHGGERRIFNTLASTVPIRGKLAATYAGHAGPDVPYRPLSDPAHSGVLDALAGTGFSMSKEMSRGNARLAAALVALGAQDAR